MKTVALEKVRIDGGTQIREKLNEDTVAEYAEILQDKDGDGLPPVSVVFDGTDYWLWDGFHRWHAHKRAGIGTIQVDIENGTQRDAILKACGANSNHGLKRTTADKRKAVETLLNDEEWVTWSDNVIAEKAAVSQMMVSRIRSELKQCFNSPAAKAADKPKKGRDGKMYPPKPKRDDQPSRQEQVAEFFGGGDDESSDVQTVPTDKIGQEIPEHLAAAHNYVANLRAIGRQIDGISRQVEESSEVPGGECVSASSIQAALKTAKDGVTSAAYSTACPKCGGDGCERCDERGWLAEKHMGTLSPDERELLGL